MIALLFTLISFSWASDNCQYVREAKILKSSYSSICYAEISCTKYSIPIYNTASCFAKDDGTCPSVNECINDKRITYLETKFETFQNTQKEEMGVAK